MRNPGSLQGGFKSNTTLPIQSEEKNMADEQARQEGGDRLLPKTSSIRHSIHFKLYFPVIYMTILERKRLQP